MHIAPNRADLRASTGAGMHCQGRKAGEGSERHACWMLSSSRGTGGPLPDVEACPAEVTRWYSAMRVSRKGASLVPQSLHSWHSAFDAAPDTSASESSASSAPQDHVSHCHSDTLPSTTGLMTM